VPYSAIIKLIPQELWGKLAPSGVAGYNYSIPRKSVLEQLPHGAVKVSFGELRRNAPPGVLINGTAEDTRLVDLPLSELLAQLHPDSLSRRPDQARVAVSSEVPDLFGARGERLAPLRVMEKKEVATTSFTRQKGAAAPIAFKPPAPPNTVQVPPAQAPAPVIRMQPTAPGAAPASPPRPAAPIPFSIPKQPAQPTAQTPPAAPPAVASPIRPLPIRSAPPAVPTAQVPQAFAPAAPQAPVQPQVPAEFATPYFSIALDAVAASWPEGVRQELAQLKIPDAKITLPPVDICDGLKRGRIQYAWRTLRSWIQPTPYYATPSPHDEVMLELPLRTLTPLFLDFIRSNPVNRQVADAENITEFFRKAEQATATSPELLQPLFSPAPTAVPTPAPQPAAPAGFTPATPAAPIVVPASITASPGMEATITNGAICLPIPLIANGWPEPVMRDIASFGLAGSRIEIPLPLVEAGVKAGRIEFVWRELCGWLNPPSKPAMVSINAENRITLPLGLIAPLFLKSRGAGQARKRANVSEEIPDLFSAAGKPVTPSTVAAQTPASPAAAVPVAPAPAFAPQSAATSAPSAAATSAPPAAATSAPPAAATSVPPAAATSVPPAAVTSGPKKTPTNLSELFNEPGKKSWTPNEIVQRTTTLPNVAGALIALQDGLLVATNMPAELKTETIAAFVPQIFGRMNQYSKELQMGDTRAVSFTVDCGTVQVFNAGIIYFAAYGKSAALLPLAELHLIAAELGRHTK
jgi:predicted regulator of Ras-like GTPase activity (Roadblock/LC7/MglB family)